VRQSLPNLPDVWLSEISRLLPELLIERPDLAAPNPIQEAWQQQRFFSALAHVILGLPQPILLFVDDLQWCQPDLWNWFCFLLHFEPRARFMLLGAIRDEEISENQLFSRLCHDCRHDGSFVQIGVGRLNQLATAELAQQIAGKKLAAEEIACIYAETEGVPLLVVALAARLAGTVALEVDKELWGVPERVRALVEEPLTSLSPAAQEVAALGAVIGRTFCYDLLAAVSGKPETVLIEALEELCRRRILREHEVGSYTFSHNRLHRAVYAGLSQPKQRLLREKINAELARQHAPATLTF
jgi:predicted ATPase